MDCKEILASFILWVYFKRSACDTIGTSCMVRKDCNMTTYRFRTAPLDRMAKFMSNPVITIFTVYDTYLLLFTP